MSFTTSHLHTPKINKVNVYDKHNWASIFNFLENDAYATKFVPDGIYTLSEQVFSPNDCHYILLGAGGPKDRYLADGSIHNIEDGDTLYGFTEIRSVDANGAIYPQAPSSGLTDLFTMKDIAISQYTNQLTSYLLDLRYPKFIYLSNVGLSEYAVIPSSSRSIYATGTSEILIENSQIHGFASNVLIDLSSSYNLSSSCYFGTCENIRIDNTVLGGLGYASWGPLSFYNCRNVKLNDISLVDVNASYSYPIKVSTSAGYTSSIDIDGLYLEYYKLSSSNVYGMFMIQDADCKISVRNLVYGQYTDDMFPGAHINPTQLGAGKVTVRGPVIKSGATTFVPSMTGFVTSPLSTYAPAELTPCAKDSTSVPTAETLYTVSVRPVYLGVKGGTGVVPTISGVAPVYNSAGTFYYINVGDYINFGAFSVAPTISAYFLE